jgi:hypothetical protein
MLQQQKRKKDATFKMNAMRKYLRNNESQNPKRAVDPITQSSPTRTLPFFSLPPKWNW